MKPQALPDMNKSYIFSETERALRLGKSWDLKIELSPMAGAFPPTCCH